MAKRNLTKTGGGKIKSPDPLKKNERQFGEALRDMVRLMGRIYEHQVLNELHVSTVKKFSDSVCFSDEKSPVFVKVPHSREIEREVTKFIDKSGYVYDESEYRRMSDYNDPLADELEPVTQKVSHTHHWHTVETRNLTDREYLARLGFSDKQVGNYAAVFLKINKKVTRKLLDRFSDKRIEKIARKHLQEVNRRNAKQIYERAEDAVGIPAKQLLADEGLTFKINAMELETAQWAKKLRDESLESFTANSLRVMAEGGSLEDVLEQFRGMEEKRARHAEMVARTQINTFNSLLTKARAENLGIKTAEWVTAGDERVRKCHQVRDGKSFELGKGLYASCDGKTLLPGQDYNCRCTYILKIPETEQEQ